MSILNTKLLERKIETLRETKTKTLVGKPIGFNWDDMPAKVHTDGQGKFDCTWSAKLEHEGPNVFYVDINNGNDSNDGLTLQTAFRTLNKIRSINADIVYVEDGVYPRNDGGLNGGQFDGSISIKALPGTNPIITTHDELAWSLESGNVYKSTRSSVQNVVDVAEDGQGEKQFLKMEKVGNVEECQNLSGSYYTDGSEVWVHTFDSRPADNNVWALLSPTNLKFEQQGGSKLYLEGLTFLGGSNVAEIKTTNTAPVYFNAKDCRFLFSGTGNVLSVRGGNCVFESCEASYGFADGFNYHDEGSVPCTSVECKCWGHSNGLLDNASNSHNGSSMHGGGKILRVDCIYNNNKGPNVVDVDESVLSWNLGVVAFESAADEHSNTNFRCREGKMWLDHCVSYGSVNAFSVTQQGTLYKRRLEIEGEEIEQDGGVIQRY